jgi:hypothetical protein
MTEPSQSTLGPNLELWVIAWAYPVVSFPVQVAGGADRLENAVLLAFVLPVLILAAVIARRIGGTRYSWVWLLVFVIWMGVIGYAHLWICASASASI